MSARDELAAVIAEHKCRVVEFDGCVCNCGTVVTTSVTSTEILAAWPKHQAAVVLALLRPEVTTPEQLAALPEGTLFRSGDRLGRLWAHSASALDGGHVWADKHDALPLEVLA